MVPCPFIYFFWFLILLFSFSMVFALIFPSFNFCFAPHRFLAQIASSTGPPFTFHLLPYTPFFHFPLLPCHPISLLFFFLPPWFIAHLIPFLYTRIFFLSYFPIPFPFCTVPRFRFLAPLFFFPTLFLPFSYPIFLTKLYPGSHIVQDVLASCLFLELMPEHIRLPTYSPQYVSAKQLPFVFIRSSNIYYVFTLKSTNKKNDAS